MVGTGVDLPLKRYIFELTIHKLSLNIENSTLVYFLWTSGNNRSQSCDSILLDPASNTHKINQKVVIHHSFSNDLNVDEYYTTLKVVDAEYSNEDNVLAECELDLVNLLRNHTKHTVTYSMKSCHDPNASLKFSVNITTFIIDDANDDSSMSWGLSNSDISDSLSLDKSISTGMDNDKLYMKINRMATKLAKVEREIQSKTMKLTKISCKDGNDTSDVRSKLGDEISKKDLQIKILLRQLDEMHTALAISHQRELELGTAVHTDGISGKTVKRNADVSNMKSPFNPLMSSRFDIGDEAIERNHSQPRYKYPDRKVLHSNGNTYNRARTDNFQNAVPSTTLHTGTLGASRLFNADQNKMRDFGQLPISRHIPSTTFSRGTFNRANTGVGTANESVVTRFNKAIVVPRMVSSDSKLNQEVPRLVVTHNVDVIPTNVATLANVKTLMPVLNTPVETNKNYLNTPSINLRENPLGRFEVQITGLERELAETKVTLADVETTKECEINEMRKKI